MICNMYVCLFFTINITHIRIINRNKTHTHACEHTENTVSQVLFIQNRTFWFLSHIEVLILRYFLKNIMEHIND